MSILKLRKFHNYDTLDAERINEPFIRIHQDFNGFLTNENFSNTANIHADTFVNVETVKSRKLAPTKEIVFSQSTDLTLTTSFQDVPGLTATLNPEAGSNIIIVFASILFKGTTTATGNSLGELQQDGVSKTGNIIMANGNANNINLPPGQCWFLSGVAAGSTTIKIRARKTINAGTVTAKALYSYMGYVVYS